MFFYYYLFAPCSFILKSVTHQQISCSGCQTFRRKILIHFSLPLKQRQALLSFDYGSPLSSSRKRGVLRWQWLRISGVRSWFGGREDSWEEREDLPGWGFGSSFGSVEAGVMEEKGYLHPLLVCLKEIHVVFPDIRMAIVTYGQGSWALKVPHLSVALVIF